MENSSSSSSNGSSPVHHAPPYFRLNSEVVEKPSSQEDSLGFMVVPDSSECPVSSSPGPSNGPSSPASVSSKADNDGASDVELEGQGDVDEGFDEEFEEKEVNEIESNHFDFGDLDPKELQQLLDVDPHLPNLDDYDLGVDVLDSEQTHPILSPSSIRSASIVSSPHQLSVSASPLSVDMEVMQMNQFNEYNRFRESVGSEEPASVQSCGSGTSNAEDLPLEMLVNECVVPQPDTTNDARNYPPTTFAGPGLVDLAETSRLLSANTFDFVPALSSEMTVDTQSMYMFGNGTGHLSLLPNGSHVTSDAIINTQVTTLMDSTMFSSPSPQTHPRTSTLRETQSLSPAPHHSQPSTPPSVYSIPYNSSPTTPPSPSPSVEQDQVSVEDRKIIEMPYYQFRKLLDDASIPEKRKEDMKNIRRRGKNKVAAKACRQKKMSLIMGLEQEVEQLRKQKQLVAVRTQSLEKEIAELKRKCYNR